MPILYSIDTELDIIRERWEGEVSAAELREHWIRYLADPRVLEIRKTLVDLRRARITFTGDELWFLIETVVVPKLGGRDWTTAIVTDDRVQFGVSRQYQVFAESYSEDAIFDDEGEAVRWLTRQR